MRKAFAVAVLLTTGLTVGCYHAVIETGRPPSPQTIRIEWAHSFIAGLVPPNVVNAAKKCPSGVARVETEHSFLNMVANVVTGGIYSPMTIIVTCAAGSSSSSDGEATAATPEVRVPAGASVEQSRDALSRAAGLARSSGRPVLVRFE